METVYGEKKRAYDAPCRQRCPGEGEKRNNLLLRTEGGKGYFLRVFGLSAQNKKRHGVGGPADIFLLHVTVHAFSRENPLFIDICQT
jgi:hypothetical protein